MKYCVCVISCYKDREPKKKNVYSQKNCPRSQKPNLKHVENVTEKNRKE